MKSRLVRIFIGAVLFVLALVADALWEMGAYTVLLYLPSYAIVGYDVLWSAVRSLVRARMLDENFLMAVATLGAFAVRECSEAVAVMLFYRVGEAFEHAAVLRSRRYLSSLLSLRAETARVVCEGGISETCDPEDVAIGAHILVGAGERVPLDGMVVEGESLLDTSALTGESVPRAVSRGDEVLAGCVCGNGTLVLRVVRPYEASAVARILQTVEDALEKKSRAEGLITRFARIYTPAVVVAAILLATVPLLAGGAWQDWLYRALSFLVVSCPCALIISVPLSFFGGIGGMARIGVLVKGGADIEALGRVSCAVFDKTGTLTEGRVRLLHCEVCEDSKDESTLLRLAAHAEISSQHPLAEALRTAYSAPLSADLVTEITEHAGCGVEARVEGWHVAIGNARLMARIGISVGEEGTVRDALTLYMALNGHLAAVFSFADTVRKGAREALEGLSSCGVHSLVMLSGDTEAVSKGVAKELGIARVHASLLPEEKVTVLECVMRENARGGTMFVGDGINDAPVLARADVGVAMGGIGADAAIEVADIVIMTDDLSRLAEAITRARRTVRIARQNIVFALLVKFGVLALSALGFASLWLAVFADVGVAFLAILNALRTLHR